MAYSNTQTTDLRNDSANTLLDYAAIAVQLPPHLYQKMLDRRDAVMKHLERDDSPLQGQIRTHYLQGSVAIGATIRAFSRTDGYDIDSVIEYERSWTSPEWALDTLYDAVKGDADSQRYNKVKRQSRCVTIEYHDGMHLDLTPSHLIHGEPPRLSFIPHSSPEKPRNEDRKIYSNSYAFAKLYNNTCPKDSDFQTDHVQRLAEVYKAKWVPRKFGETLSLPDFSAVDGGVSSTTSALQLVKRNRDIQWGSRHGRTPPSVMLTCLALECAEPNRTIGENVVAIAEHICNRLNDAKEKGELIKVINPECERDCFTDRWPENHEAQNLLSDDMDFFLRKMDKYFRSDDLEARLGIIKCLFGEDVANRVETMNRNNLKHNIKTGNHEVGATGRILPLTTPAIVAASPIPRNTFYGGTSLLLPRIKPCTVLSLASQMESMKRDFPHFKCRQGAFPMSVEWEGNLYGNHEEFRIHILLNLPFQFEDGDFLQLPIVRVLKPRLKPNFNAINEAPLPHVYRLPNNLPHSPLCLFDPRRGEWDHSMYLSRTIVPWTIRWLACYEVWKASGGRWVGGGSH